MVDREGKSVCMYHSETSDNIIEMRKDISLLLEKVDGIEKRLFGSNGDGIVTRLSNLEVLVRFSKWILPLFIGYMSFFLIYVIRDVVR